MIEFYQKKCCTLYIYINKDICLIKYSIKYKHVNLALCKIYQK